MARSQPRADSAYRPHYVYRRALTLAESGTAVGVGVGVGVLAFYLASLLLQRTPLAATPSVPLNRVPATRTPGTRAPRPTG